MSPSPQSPLKSIARKMLISWQGRLKTLLRKKKKKRFNRFFQEENEIRLLVRGQFEVIFVLLFVMQTS
jgi:hypothetical protein